ncbi:MAG: hypothetical protein LBD20_00165, partial [Spirochaetaceae bacterium]|nr:hypothetical protein [Spirochaetaceae bacterium]
MTGAHLTADAGTTVTINNFVGGADFTTNTADAFGNLQLNIPVSVSSMVSLNQAITAEHIAITGSTSQFINFGLLTNTVSSVEFNVQGNISFKAAPKTGAFFTVAGGASSNGTIEIITTNSITLAPVSPITANGAITIDAGGSTAPIQTGNDIIIGADTTITSSNGAVILKGNIASPAAPPTPYDLNISAASTITISGHIGANAYPFCTDILSLTAPTINLYNNIYTTNATNSSTTAITGSAVYIPTTPFTVSTHTLNIPAPNSLTAAAASSFTIQTDDFTGVTGTINAGTGSSSLTLFPLSSTRNVILGNTGFVSGVLDYVFFNTSIFGTGAAGGARIIASQFFIGDGNAAFGDIYVTDIGSAGGRFDCPLDMRAAIDKKIIFKNDIYMSKRLRADGSNTSIISFDNTLTINTTGDFMCYKPADINTTYAVTIESLNMMFLASITGGTSTKLTLTNSGGLSLYGNVNIGELLQNGQGNCSIPSSSPIMIKTVKGIRFASSIELQSTGTKLTFETTNPADGTVVLAGNITSNAANCEIYFKVAADITVNGAIGTAARKFREVAIAANPVVRNVTFDGIVYANNYTQDGGSGYTWFKSDINYSIDNFAFTGMQLTTKMLKCNGIITIANSDIWRSGNWDYAGATWNLPAGGGADITGASIYQSGTGDCYLSGRLIANANIAFSGNIHIYTDTLNIRNAGESGASSLGTISLAGLRRGSSYVGNVSIQTGTETAANTVAISGTIGESGTPLGIVEIAHAGTLKLGPTTPTTGNAIDIYVQRFHQKTSSADTELNVQMLSAAGSQGDLTSGMGGIVFMGKTVLKRMGTITFKTHNITNNGKSIIHFEGAVVGGSNILIEDSYAAITFNGAIGSTGAVLPAPGEKIGRPASAPTNTYDTYALEIRNIHSSSGDITINGPIYAGGPIWLHPNFSTSHTVTIKGDILIDEYTYNFPNDLSTKIHAASTLINVERIIVGNSIEFRYPLSFDFSPPNEAPRLRIESTSSGGTIFLQDDIISARNGIELVTQETGFVTIKKIMSVASSTASNPAEPTDYLYIKTGTLKFDNTSSYNIHTGGFHGTRRIVRFVVKKKIDFQNSSTPVLLYAANGKGDIYIQPWNADQPLYFYTADFSAPADSNGLYIHARLFAAMRAKRVFFGSPNTTSNPPTHGYMVNPLDVNNLTIWNGTGSFHLGGGNLPLASTVSGPFTGSDQTSENMYDLYMFTNGLLINFLFGNTAYEGINLFRPKNFFIYAPNAQIISNRTPTSSGLEYADITVKSYIQANETIEGTVFFKVKSIGTAGYPLVINTPNMGSASGIAADITESMYVKNIYYQQPGSGGVKIWKIQSSDTANGTVAINNANSGIEQPAQAGGIAAQHLHIKAANDINLTTNNAIEKTATLESESTNTNNITFTNSAAGNLVLSAKNTGAGSITITENSGSLTIDALSRPAMVGGSLAGVEGAGGTIVLQPKTGSALYIGQSSPSAPADVVVKSNVGGPGGSIFFNAPVLSGSTTHPHNLTLAAGTSRMQFFQYVGALPGASPSSYNTASHLGTVKIESGTVTKTTGSDFFIAANSLELGTAGGAVALIDTSGDQVKHITLRVNGLVKNTGSNIKAGDNVIPRPWGRFKIYPLTAAYTVQYAPTSTPGYDVYYSSSWPDIIAESFTVGDAAHLANITIDSVTATLFELAVQNGGTASIIIKNDYTSVNKPLTMQSGSGGIVLEGDSTLAGPASVTLGTAGFTASSRFTLKHLTTGTITARGGITLGEVTADTQTASSGDANLILNAGTSPVSITGNIGTNTGAPNASSRLGAFTIASSGQITLGGSLYTSGNITLAVSDANRNIQLTSTGQTEISSGSGMFMLSGNAALTHANGLFLNTLFNGASSPVELTLNAAAAGNTVTLKSGGDYAMQTNAGRLIFAGKSQTLNANGATLPGQTRLAMDAAAAVTLVSSDVRQSIGELHIQSGKLDLNGQKWGLGVSPAGGFLADGASSSLVMAANTALTTQGGFTVQNGAALNLDPASKIAFSNTTPQSLNVPAAAQLGSIEIAANAALTLASAIIVTGSWAQLGGRNTFDHNDQTVTFSGARLHDIRVGDANTAAADREIIWKRLIAQTPGMTLRFDNWPAKHTVLDELRIEGAVGSPITLTRLTGGVTPPSSRPTDLAAGTAAHNGFWYLDPPNSGGVISVKDLYVEYSFVKKDEPIEPPLNVSVTPYYTTAQNVSSHYTVNWLRRNVFIYTWAEDA